MPLVRRRNLSPQDMREVEELALLEGIPLSEENLIKLYEECRESATSNPDKEDEKDAKRDLWAKQNGLNR